MAGFEELGLAPWIVKQMEKLGLKKPTPIQQACIPKILNELDCIGTAKTGSGKTFAFALPILQKLSEDPKGYFSLILTPTHELAYQISEQFLVAGKPMGCRVCVISGGSDQMIESQNLQKRPHIIVAMPGRLADHLTGCNTFSFRNLKYLVIDEADRMFNGEYDEALEIISKNIPIQRNTLLFTATFKDYIKESKIFQLSNNYFEWAEESQVATVESLDQRYILCAEYDRDMVMVEALRKFKEEHKDANVMIFTNTKQCCQILSMTLNSIGFENVCIHGYMRHKERVAALSQFKSNRIRIIIATDVASRGLDIPNVNLVINHRLPKHPNDYIHRVGRTARAGRDGLAISIFRFPRDLEFLGEIEKAINTKLTEHKIDPRLVERIFFNVNVSKREAELKLDNTNFYEKQQNYRRINWIKNDLDPDKMEEEYKKQKLEKVKENRKKRKEKLKEIKRKNKEILKSDERFGKIKQNKRKKNVK